jgi:hypothetical protein
MALLLLNAGVSNAQYVRGYITSSCEEWVEESKKANLDIDKAALEAAMLAYLSGFAAGTRKDFLRDSDWPSIGLWMNNYCAANPLDELWQAAEKLAFELIRRQGIE